MSIDHNCQSDLSSRMSSGAETPVKSAASRGDRLYPQKHSRIYWVLTQLRQCYQELIDEHLAGRESLRLVDYGCGNMPYRPLFPSCEYLGADFPGNELADVTIGNDGALPLADRCCDVVVSSQVLEHVKDVSLYLAEARRVLKEDGLLFLSTHGMWKYHPDPDDYWRWTCDGLKKTVTEAGFDVMSFRGVLGAGAAALQLWQDAFGARVPTRLRWLYFRYMQWRIQRVDARYTEEWRAQEASVYMLVAHVKK